MGTSTPAKMHSDPAPHIPLETGTPRIPEWVTIALLAGVAMVAGMVLFYLMH